MRPPHVGLRVTLVVPQRESIPARVSDAGADWIELLAEGGMRSAPPVGATVFVHYVTADGVLRMACRTTQRQAPGFGDHVRLTHRRHVQLLKRPDLVRAPSAKRVTVTPLGPDAVATDALAVGISGGGLRIKGLPFARKDQLLHFDLALDPREPLVSGQGRVDRVLQDGDVELRFTVLGARERSALVSWCLDHGSLAA